MPFLGFLGVFGRSRELRQLDRAFRDVDLHPQLVPEAVKLAMIKFMKGDPGGEAGPAAALVAYCMTGAEAFAGANGPEARRAVEARIEQAVTDGDGFDAQLVLLTLHAGVAQPSVVAEFDLKAA